LVNESKHFKSEDYSIKVEVNIKISDELKQILVDDWNIVNNQHKLFILPAAKSIESILNEYLTLKIEKQCDKLESILVLKK
jgi:hypothetical protein